MEMAACSTSTSPLLPLAPPPAGTACGQGGAPSADELQLRGIAPRRPGVPAAPGKRALLNWALACGTAAREALLAARRLPSGAGGRASSNPAAGRPAAGWVRGKGGTAVWASSGPHLKLAAAAWSWGNRSGFAEIAARGAGGAQGASPPLAASRARGGGMAW